MRTIILDDIKIRACVKGSRLTPVELSGKLLGDIMLSELSAAIVAAASEATGAGVYNSSAAPTPAAAFFIPEIDRPNDEDENG